MSGPRPQRGVVFPSPVVMFSIVVVAVAALAFVLTRHQGPTQEAVITAAQHPAKSSAPPVVKKSPALHKKKPKAPAVNRGKVYVVVFNNSGITGLAAQVGQKASTVGWNVVGADNWYGSIPTNTVYYPKRLEAAGKQLALDLGIRRTAPAVAPMKLDRLTVILTAPLH